METIEIRDLRTGVNQIGVRALNERLIMSLLQRHGPMPGSDLAKRTELSAQTVSNILRKLEADGFLKRGKPQRGKVGKPSVPMELVSDGALAFGLKIGRRSADFALMNLAGEVLDQSQITYRYPMPDQIFTFLRERMSRMSQDLPQSKRSRICGVGIGAPFEIWSWSDHLNAPEEFKVWADISFEHEFRKFSDLPLFTENDATAACRAEHFFGRGREFGDYGYFFVGSFIGGGVVMDNSVVEGPHRNAGSFGPIRTPVEGGGTAPLLDQASLYLLEAALHDAGHDTNAMWTNPQDWSDFGKPLDDWIETSAKALAEASRTICAVIDFEAILIDGAFPPSVRARLVERTSAALAKLDMRGVLAPRIEAARVGGNARVMGAAISPIFSQYFFP